MSQEPREESVGEQMYALCRELFPICRSITGDGVRETLRIVGRHIPLELSEVPTGTQVFDWTVPKEWNIRDAYIRDSRGEKVVDFQELNLHVVNYSVPIRTQLPLEALKAHLFSVPDRPDLVPYRTSYYKETWGFCLAHERLLALEDGDYEVVVDSTLEPGALSYAECVVPGDSAEEVLISAHVCHPSLANDNLSGIALATYLARALSERPHRYTYRFIFAPGTIGSITWLARNEAVVPRIRHGLVVSCVGDSGGPTYKRSRQGSAEIDRAVGHVLSHCGRAGAKVEDFSPYGYDERQYCSPGFNLPVGLFERSKYGSFPEYHTSGDNLDFITVEALNDSYRWISQVISILEGNDRYLNTNPKCEPQLGKRGLYNALGGSNDSASTQMAMLWVLNLSDGDNSLLDIAERGGIPFETVHRAASLLEDAGLLVSCTTGA